MRASALRSLHRYALAALPAWPALNPSSPGDSAPASHLPMCAAGTQARQAAIKRLKACMNRRAPSMHYTISPCALYITLKYTNDNIVSGYSTYRQPRLLDSSASIMYSGYIAATYLMPDISQLDENVSAT